ncbi:ATP-binding protein [Serinicoccus sp. LYQ131]|uniref:ATP-binding protein n=1 Tax=Serinicoccus sp. LYQ131 TaxID=3378797 RepID=UPI0038529397
MSGDQHYRMESLAVPESLEDLHVLLEQVGSEHPEVSAADLMMFETAVVEIAGNVIEHGRPEGRVSFIFELTVLPDRLECLLTDTSAQPVPDLDDRTMPQSDQDEDGRGLALAQMALDRIDCEHVDGVNRWTLVRNRH